jgi:hypothetical protein
MEGKMKTGEKIFLAFVAVLCTLLMVMMAANVIRTETKKEEPARIFGTVSGLEKDPLSPNILIVSFDDGRKIALAGADEKLFSIGKLHAIYCKKQEYYSGKYGVMECYAEVERVFREADR